MSSHFSMGAINKNTGNYEYPKIAKKINKYKCPSCEKDVIFKNGKIKLPHFAHYKSENPCFYYDKPTESQIHKDAKLLMKYFFDNKKHINIYRKCRYCYKDPEYFLNIRNDIYTKNVITHIEYKFNYNNSNKSADVALLQNKELKYIFEICYKNKTKEENRPEPWFEIKAENLINETNSGENVNNKGEIEIECIRDYMCDCCRDNKENEMKRYIEVLEKLQIKEREQKLEKVEMLLMSKEDYRTIELQIKLELEKEKEKERIKKEYECKERERIKTEYKYREKEREKKKQEEEKQRGIDEYNKKIIELNKVCSVCNINYCKCIKSNFFKDKYNIFKCVECSKRKKCKCLQITDFFKSAISLS
jgi:hypothetical protein